MSVMCERAQIMDRNIDQLLPLRALQYGRIEIGFKALGKYGEDMEMHNASRKHKLQNTKTKQNAIQPSILKIEFSSRRSFGFYAFSFCAFFIEILYHSLFLNKKQRSYPSQRGTTALL
jgi:hypothetical protein